MIGAESLYLLPVFRLSSNLDLKRLLLISLLGRIFPTLELVKDTQADHCDVAGFSVKVHSFVSRR